MSGLSASQRAARLKGGRQLTEALARSLPAHRAAVLAGAPTRGDWANTRPEVVSAAAKAVGVTPHFIRSMPGAKGHEHCTEVCITYL